MADWATFSGAVGVILVLLLVLARASATVLDEAALSESEPTESADSADSAAESRATTDSEADPDAATDMRVDAETDSRDSTAELVDTEESAHIESETVEPDENVSNGDSEAELSASESVADGESIRQPIEPTDKPTVPSLSTPALLANVVLSQGLFGSLLVLMAWYTGIPARAFGLSAAALSVEAVGMGTAVGVALYGLNEAAAAVARWQGVSTPSMLREALAPETTAGWAILLVVVLPIIAGFEELLFRGALIGVVHAGFGISPWLLALGSSAAFALGHGAQGRLGIVVTGLLGLGLAAVFVLTESLIVVIVAHYVVNAAEFVVHEGRR